MTTSTAPPAIAIESVTKRFGDLTAVDDVSLTITQGELVALLGPNGADKTTLLDMVLGFTPPTHGTINTMEFPPKQATSNGRDRNS